MEDVQEVSLALGHDEPVSLGCPLYNEALATDGWLAVSSNVGIRLNITDRPIFMDWSVIDHKFR